MPDLEIESGSFRDRHGRVFYRGNRVFRTLSATGLEEWRRLSSCGFYRQLAELGKIVPTREVDLEEAIPLREGEPEWAGALEHQKIPFVSYPYEWPFHMLKDAALLQLELLEAALDDGMTLKDSTSFNVQWQGIEPVFIDLLSFEELKPGEAWNGYRQFCQLFLYPLLLQAYKGLPFQPWLRGRLDGIPPQECNAVMSLRDCLRPGVFTHVFLQSRLQARYAAKRLNIRGQMKESGFHKDLILHNVRRLQKLINRLEWREKSSEWADYSSQHNYSDEDHRRKTEFISQVADSQKWPLVWDLGCNTGQFSRIAARNADYLVALDGDHLTIDHVYLELKREGCRSMLPLVFNLADPSPDLGWRCRERKSLTERGRPDLVLSLALIHHLVIGANIPLHEFIDWLAGLGAAVIIEFVEKSDPMAQVLLLNKDDQYDDYTRGNFERCLQKDFRIVDRRTLASQTRTLYFARPQRDD